MIRFNAANEYQTTLTAAINGAQTTLEVASTVNRPTVPFKISIGSEILDVTNVTGNTFTVVRGTEGTTGISHTLGATVENRWTAGTLNSLWNAALGDFPVVTNSYTLQISDGGALCNAFNNSVTIHLPSAIGIQGKQYTIKKTDASNNVVVIDAFNQQLIDGELTLTILFQHTSITLVSNGTNWLII